MRYWKTTSGRFIAFSVFCICAVAVSGCSKNVSIEVENQCDFRVDAIVNHHAFDPITNADFAGVFAEEIESKTVTTLEVDMFYPRGFLWVRPDGGTWGFEIEFEISDDNRGYLPSIDLEGAVCVELATYVE